MVAFVGYDKKASVVAALPQVEWRDRATLEHGAAKAEWTRARLRWSVSEFASMVMRSSLEKAGVVSDQNAVDDFVYGLRPLRAGTRTTTTQRLLMTGRGIGKTTRLKIRAFHGMLFGLTKVSVAIAASHTDAVGWVKSIRSWIEDPPPILAYLFPEISFTAKDDHITIKTRFGESHLLARSFTGALRGLNVKGVRPDALYLDDIEGEDKVSLTARNKNQIRLCSKILPLVPLEGGAEIWWVQTPVHPDAVAVRTWKGAEGLEGWTTRRLPVVRSWPESEEAVALWAENRKIYSDVGKYGEDKAARTKAAHLHYVANIDAMQAGSEVLDPQRMPIDVAYRRRWDVGEAAWFTEFEIRTQAPGVSTLEPDTWPTFSRVGEEFVRINGEEHHIGEMELAAHYDPSDGGDDGALVIVGKHQGRWYLLAPKVWHTSRLSIQISEIPEVLRPFVELGLDELQWEPTTGSASVVKQQIEDSLSKAKVYIDVVDKHSTEKKEARITATLEPKGAAGWLCLPDDLHPTLFAQIQTFDAGQRDNVDDFLDAYQRAVERLDGVGISRDDLANSNWFD